MFNSHGSRVDRTLIVDRLHVATHTSMGSTNKTPMIVLKVMLASALSRSRRRHLNISA